MRTLLDCVPCIVRQALDAVRRTTADVQAQTRVLRQTLRHLAAADYASSPPALAQVVHRAIRELTHGADAYRDMKDASNSLALEILPALRERVRTSAAPLETAIRLAIAGNVIDAAITQHPDRDHVLAAVEHALAAPLDADVDTFRAAIARARTILYLADNAGEIVLDRLLVEQLPAAKVTVAVRGTPVINDATMADARVAGLTEIVEVIDNGSDAPGTILEDCSDLFRERFGNADLIIAKGQGNYETLSSSRGNVFFVLKAKCPVIAAHLGCRVGDLILKGP